MRIIITLSVLCAQMEDLAGQYVFYPAEIDQ